MVFEGDIRSFSPQGILSEIGINPGELDLLFGGPPCQAFSQITWVSYPELTFIDSKLTFNDKEHTITRAGTIQKIMPYFQVTLLEGSDKAYGTLIDPKAFVEGYIEPLSTTDIVKNKQFIGYDAFRKI